MGFSSSRSNNMIRKTTQAKVAASFNLLKKYGIQCVVPGMYDLYHAEEAVMFANDKELFYRYVESPHMLRHLAEKKA
jgi:histone acetyltransferase (RNA polymerase elongator complex component)